MKSEKVFNHTHPFTIGVEEELMICHPENGDLIDKANEIMEELTDEFKQRFSYELILSEIEINTPICNSVNHAIDELSKLRSFTRKLGDKLGFTIGMGGTHPTALPNEQTFVSNDSYNWVSEQLHYYAERNITFATHIHIAVPDAESAIKITNSLRRWIAPLLALSCNSPFYAGEYTHFKSARTMQFGAFPRTNIPPYFDSFKAYDDLVNKYKKLDSIEKSRQIWWKLRPHMDYGTIEFRMLDAQRSLKNTEMFIALAQALVYQSYQDFKNNLLNEKYSEELLNDSLWKASRFNLDAKIENFEDNSIHTLRNSINQMVEYCNDALLHFNTAHIVETLKNILENGTEGDLQYEYYNRNGMESLKKYLIENVDYNL